MSGRILANSPANRKVPTAARGVKILEKHFQGAVQNITRERGPEDAEGVVADGAGKGAQSAAKDAMSAAFRRRRWQTEDGAKQESSAKRGGYSQGQAAREGPFRAEGAPRAQGSRMDMNKSARMRQARQSLVMRQRKTQVTGNGLAGFSYGDPEAKQAWRQTTPESFKMRQREAGSRVTGGAAAKKSAAKNAGKQAAASAARKSAAAGTKKAGNAVGKWLSQLGKRAAGMAKWALPILVVVLILIIVAVIVSVVLSSLASPLGFFFSDNSDENPYSVNNIIAQGNQSWADELASTRQEYEDQGYIVSVDYNTGDNGDSIGRVNNWPDVFSLYVARTNGPDKSSIAFTAQDTAAIEEMFGVMDPISVETRTDVIETEVEKEVTRTIEHVRYEYDRALGKLKRIVTYETVTETVTEVETEEIRYADILVQNLRYVQVLDKYPLTEEQESTVRMMTSPEMASSWSELLGVDYGGGGMLSDAQAQVVLNNLPKGTKGAAIVQAAFTRMGDPYSMELRGQGNYVDCSYLTQWSYAQAGVSIPGTAAAQAEWCANNGKLISASDVQAGDLIFWSYPNNSRVAGRFMQIGHVAIYVSDGMMIEAAPSAGCVTYRAVSVQGSPVLYARPHV